jgi:hypothetical protein
MKAQEEAAKAEAEAKKKAEEEAKVSLRHMMAETEQVGSLFYYNAHDNF